MDVERRVSNLCMTEQIFNECKGFFEDCLEKSGYNYKLKYKPDPNFGEDVTRIRNRHRTITYYNPPWDNGVATNIGKEFLKLIDSSFPKEHPLKRVCNRNTIKVTYSTMSNMKQHITGLNKLKLEGKTTNTIAICKCRNNPCPLQGKCDSEDIVYRGQVEDKEGKKYIYIGMTSEPFRKRYSKHKQSFQKEQYSTETKLSQKVWSIKKEDKICPVVKFSILKHSKSYTKGNSLCRLCIDEKLAIILNTEENLLNNRQEVFSLCRHRARHKMNRVNI